MAAHRVAGDRTPGFLRAFRFLRHADAERRQVVVEKIDEMVAVDFDNQVRFGFFHLLANLLHKSLSSHLSRRLGHFVNEPWRVRHSSGQYQFSHALLLSGIRSKRFTVILLTSLKIRRQLFFKPRSAIEAETKSEAQVCRGGFQTRPTASRACSRI